MTRALLIATVAALAAFPVAATASPPPPGPLQLGSRGPAVRALQERLIELRYLPWRSATGVYGTGTWHAVVAFQGWQRLGRSGIADRRTRRALDAARAPRPWGGLRRGLEVDTHRQVLLVVVHGRTRRALHVSTARSGYRTPTGTFHVYERDRWSWSAPFQVWMPYALYFSGGYAMHGYPDVPADPASHGCVRVPLGDAPVLFATTPVGSPVLVR